METIFEFGIYQALELEAFCAKIYEQSYFKIIRFEIVDWLRQMNVLDLRERF